DACEAPHAKRAAPVEEREQLEALAHERVGPHGLVIHERPPAGAGLPRRDLFLADAEAAELVLWEIHAPERPVLGDVAHDVDLLESEAERLRPGPRRLPPRRLVARPAGTPDD